VTTPWRPALLAALPPGRLVGTLVHRALPRAAVTPDPADPAVPARPLGRPGPRAPALLRDAVAAGGFGGDKAAVAAFATAFYGMADAFLARGWFAGKEQNVFTAVCALHPGLCALIPGGGWFDFHERLAYAADPAAAAGRLKGLLEAYEAED